jgi:mRNA-decapping enzyme subunit 2
LDNREIGLDDLCVRFIINLPQEELESVERICFQVEEAQWFYEDFIRPLDPELPSLNLRNFCLRIFQHCPLLSGFSYYHHTAAFSEFLAYKTRVPVRGAIMLNLDMDQVILVKGWKKSANWSFPRGKINKNEGDLDCAIREVYEETGFHVRDAGLVGNDEDMKYIDVTMREQQMRLYVFPGIPMNTHFAPRTRKEISKIQWYKLSELPTLKKQKQQQGQMEDLAITANKFYMVAPFMVPLKKWISQQKKMKKSKQDNKLSVPPDTKTNRITVDHKSMMNESLGVNEEVLTAAHFSQGVSKELISDLPEVSARPALIHDSAAELKIMLNVPLRDAPESSKPATANTSTSLNSSALLALLKGGSVSRSEKPSQTPLEQVNGSAKMSAPPDHHHHYLEHPQALRQTSTYFTPTELDQGVNGTRPKSEHLMPAVNSKRERHQQTMISSCVAIGNNPQSSMGNTASPPHFSPTNIPPYQITGDPQFAQNPHIPSMGTSSIPQASKIPPPKLTTHSSLLLSLFKNQQLTAAVASSPPELGQVSSPGIEPVSAEGSTSTLSRIEPSLSASLGKPEIAAEMPLVERLTENTPFKPVSKTGLQGSQIERRPWHARVDESITVPGIGQTAEWSVSRDRQLSNAVKIGKSVSAAETSDHKKSLLDLFRNPSLSNAPGPATLSSKTLELPSPLAELSASPSPAHSREPSHANTRPLGDIPRLPNFTNDLDQTHKKPAVSPQPKWTPLSATVNGPLNVPTFEVLAHASKKTRGTSHTNHLAPRVNQPLLAESSPVSSQSIPLKLGKISPTAPLAGPRDPSTQPSFKVKNIDSKLFTPQILRRPPEKQTSFPKPTAPPESQLNPLSRPSPIDAPHMNPSQDHKQALLSILNQSTQVTGSATFKAPTIISPFSDRSKLDRGFSNPVISRSRVGSVSSAIGERNAHGSREGPLPRTTPVNQSFLLGYLDGVANMEQG